MRKINVLPFLVLWFILAAGGLGIVGYFLFLIAKALQKYIGS